ncbi:MAG: carboxypeptidase-like regulatory domain-containing protein [Propionicimonas sp.]
MGRSRGRGAQLDLALTVAVHTGGEDVLDLTERLLAAAEQTTHLRIEPLPVPADGFGFLVTVAVGVPLDEPSGPPVKESVVQLHPLATISGTVVDPAGVALPDVEVRSSLTRQQTTTDAAGRFTLPGLPSPTTLTLHRGSHRTSLDVPGPATDLRIVLPTHEGS